MGAQCSTLFHALVRYFSLLENVRSLLTRELRPLFLYLLEAWSVGFERLNAIDRVSQEFSKRNMAVYWCTVTGKNVGTHAWIS